MARYDALCQIDWQAFPVNVPCEVTAIIYYKGQRPDLSGALESVGDCLEGVFVGKRQAHRELGRQSAGEDNENPRVD
jgi:hypothetical protein